jgi:hypothetical protein
MADNRQTNGRISLSGAETQVVKLIGAERQKSNENAQVRDRNHSGKPGSSIHTDGFGAELAFAKLMNVYPDLDVFCRSGGHDLKLADGRLVDVKQTAVLTGHLPIDRDKKPTDCDIYVLMIGTLPEYRYAVWIESRNALNGLHLKELKPGAGESHFVPQDFLNPDLPRAAPRDNSDLTEREEMLFESIDSDDIRYKACALYDEWVSGYMFKFGDERLARTRALDDLVKKLRQKAIR